MHCNSAIVKKATLDNSLSNPQSSVQDYDGTKAKTTTLENSLPDTQRFVQSSSKVGTYIRDDYQAKVKCLRNDYCPTFLPHNIGFTML